MVLIAFNRNNQRDAFLEMRREERRNRTVFVAERKSSITNIEENHIARLFTKVG